MFFWNALAFMMNQVDVGNLISGSSAFAKSSLNNWKFMVHILLKPGLENLGHYFTSVWDECNCVVVQTSLALPFFGMRQSACWDKCMCAKSLSRVRLSVTPWTVAYQAPLPMGFSRQGYWSGLQCPLPDPGIQPTFLRLLLRQVGSLPPAPCRKPCCLRVELQLLLGCAPWCNDGSLVSSQFSHDLHWTVCCEDTILSIL